MSRIFISYRRQDSSLMTGRIYDRLESAFGQSKVFRDIDDINPGEDFRAKLSKAIDKSDILLIIIGPKWENITDEKGNRRLDDPNDYVRLEVEAGLKRPDKTVIPVLVENASMPSSSSLPEGLKELRYRNAVSVRQDPDFNHDVQKLIREMKEISNTKLPVYQKRPVLTGIGIFFVALLIILGIRLFNTRLAPGTITPSSTNTATGMGPTGTGSVPLIVTGPATTESPSVSPEVTITPSRPIRIGIINIPDYIFTDIQERLTDLGFDAEWIGASSDYTVFSQYDVVYLPIGWAFQNVMIEERSLHYQRFVADGGGLVVEQPNFAGTLTPDLLPYKLTFKRKAYDPNEWPPIISSDHEIIEDIPASELPGPGNEISTRDNHWTVITAAAQSNSPTLLVASLAEGRIAVIATSVSERSEVRYRLGDNLIKRLITWVNQ